MQKRIAVLQIVTPPVFVFIPPKNRCVPDLNLFYKGKNLNEDKSWAYLKEKRAEQRNCHRK